MSQTDDRQTTDRQNTVALARPLVRSAKNDVHYLATIVANIATLTDIAIIDCVVKFVIQPNQYNSLRL